MLFEALSDRICRSVLTASYTYLEEPDVQPKFNLDQYLTEGVETIVKDALAASLKNPKETAFLFTYALAAKRAADSRESHAAKGKHIPSFLIATITNRCNIPLSASSTSGPASVGCRPPVR